MIDTLTATIDLYDYENIASNLIKSLEAKKNEAKLVAANSASDKVLISIGEKTFYVLPNGSKGYAYILHNDLYEVKLAQYRSTNEKFYPVFIRIKSECLWSLSPKKAWQNILDLINEHIGKIRDNKVNRLDICCHTDLIRLTLEDIEKFKGKFFNDQVIRDRRKVTGVNFGSRNSKKVYCRIYDKTKEVTKKNKKLWFYKIWENSGLNIENVWNIEFELNREFFKEFNINNIEDVFGRLGSIWEYCTNQWLVMMECDRTRIERSNVNKDWVKIQEAFKEFENLELIKRTDQLESEASALIPGTIGNITSYAAKKGILNINEILVLLKDEGIRYLDKAKETNYKGVISEKMATV